MNKFDLVCKELIELQKKKDKDYGSSFSENVKEFGLVAAVIPIANKTNRIKQLIKQDSEIKSESIRDSLIDLACYAIMTIMEVEKLKKGE